MRFARIVLAAGLAAGVAVPPGIAGASESPRRVPFTAPVTVDADGGARVGALDRVDGPLAEVVRGSLAGLPYVPARRDGSPVSSTVAVHGVAVLVPVGDEFEVVLEGVSTHPRLLVSRPPDYPMSLLRKNEGGTVSLVLQVGADGRVQGSTVAAGRQRDLIEAARDAIADWQFQPPFDGHGFETGAAFWFHGAEAGAAPDVACTVAPPAAHLPGDAGCLPLTETTGFRLRRSDVRRAR